MKSLILYSTIVGGFYAQNESLEAAVSAARARVGNDVWKHGFSGHDPGGGHCGGCLGAAPSGDQAGGAGGSTGACGLC